MLYITLFMVAPMPSFRTGWARRRHDERRRESSARYRDDTGDNSRSVAQAVSGKLKVKAGENNLPSLWSIQIAIVGHQEWGEKAMSSKFSLIVIGLITAGPAQAAAPTLKAESGYKVELRGITFHENSNGGTVTGWASRALGAFGPIEAHLHIDLIGADSATLRRVEYGKFERLPVRPKRSQRIRAALSAEQLQGVEMISVKVVAGQAHDY